MEQLKSLDRLKNSGADGFKEVFVKQNSLFDAYKFLNNFHSTSFRVIPSHSGFVDFIYEDRKVSADMRMNGDGTVSYYVITPQKQLKNSCRLSELPDDVVEVLSRFSEIKD